MITLMKVVGAILVILGAMYSFGYLVDKAQEEFSTFLDDGE